MSHKECIALSYGLDAHIPRNTNTNKMYTEFEFFYQNLLKNISNIPETKLQQIKTKLRSTYDKYTETKVPYKHRKIVNDQNRLILSFLKPSKEEVLLF